MRTLAIAFGFAVLCSGCGSSGGDGAPPVAREIIRTVIVGDRVYPYILYVPVSARANGPLPVVLVLHGGGGNAGTIEPLVQLEPKADREGFVLVMPNGYDPSDNGFATWNAGTCCGRARDDGIDNTAVIRAVLDDVATQVDTDPKRVFATGHSNGGMMAHRLACELADRIAAIAPNAGFLLKDDYRNDPPTPVFTCAPPRPVPVLHLHGLADTCSRFEGGVGTGLDRTPRPPVRDNIAFWADHNGCAATPTTSFESGDTVCETYSGCTNDAEVTLCTTEGAGHVWPGREEDSNNAACGGTVNLDYSANDFIWDFFQRHPMP